jgi:hypothetical protein
MKLHKNEKMKKKYGIEFSRDLGEGEDEEYLKGRKDEVVSRRKMEPRTENGLKEHSNYIKSPGIGVETSECCFVKTTFAFYKNDKSLLENHPVIYRKFYGYHPDSVVFSRDKKHGNFVLYESGGSQILVKSGESGLFVEPEFELYIMTCSD